MQRLKGFKLAPFDGECIFDYLHSLESFGLNVDILDENSDETDVIFSDNGETVLAIELDYKGYKILGADCRPGLGLTIYNEIKDAKGEKANA